MISDLVGLGNSKFRVPNQEIRADDNQLNRKK